MDIEYIKAGADITHETWNALFSEADRKLALVLDNKSPVCIGQIGALPNFGMPVYFGSGDMPWSKRFNNGQPVPLYNHAEQERVASLITPLWPWGGDIPQSVVDPAKKEIKQWWAGAGVRTFPTYPYQSLKVHTVKYKHPTADTEPVDYWITGNEYQPFAVAEIICEGVLEVNLPATYDRFKCFRVHNLNNALLHITFATDKYSLSVQPMQSVTVRRDSVSEGYTTDGKYFFQMRAGDPRFFKFQGCPRFEVIQNAAFVGPGTVLTKPNEANNVVNPWIISLWFDALESGITTGSGLVSDYVFTRKDYSKLQDCASEFTWWNKDGKLFDAVIAKGTFAVQHKTTLAIRYLKWNGIDEDVTDLSGEKVADFEKRIIDGKVHVRCVDHYAINIQSNLYDNDKSGAVNVSNWTEVGTIANQFSGVFATAANATTYVTVSTTGKDSISYTIPTCSLWGNYPGYTQNETFKSSKLTDSVSDIQALPDGENRRLTYSPSGLIQSWDATPTDASVLIHAFNQSFNSGSQVLSPLNYNNDFTRTNVKNWSIWYSNDQPFQLPTGKTWYASGECLRILPISDGSFSVYGRIRSGNQVCWPRKLSWEPSWTTGGVSEAQARRWGNDNTHYFPSLSAQTIAGMSEISPSSLVFPQLLHWHYNAIAQTVNITTRYYPLNWKCIPELPYFGLSYSGVEIELGPYQSGGETDVSTQTIVPAEQFIATTSEIKSWADKWGVQYSDVNELDDYLDSDSVKLRLYSTGGTYAQEVVNTSTYRARLGYPRNGQISFGAIKKWAESIGFRFVHLSVRMSFDIENFPFESVDFTSAHDGREVFIEGNKFGLVPGSNFVSIIGGTIGLQKVGTDGFYLNLEDDTLKLNYSGTNFEKSSAGILGYISGQTGNTFAGAYIGGITNTPLLSIQRLEVRSYGLPAVIRHQVHKTASTVDQWKNDNEADMAKGLDYWPKQESGLSVPVITLQEVEADSITYVNASASGHDYPLFVHKLLTFDY